MLSFVWQDSRNRSKPKNLVILNLGEAEVRDLRRPYLGKAVSERDIHSA